MIRTILVPTSGTPTDESVFATAAAIGVPLRAHLEFLHLRLTPAEAALNAPHTEYCIGRAVNDMLEHMRLQDQQLHAKAVQHFDEFCRSRARAAQAAPAAEQRLSTDWSEETDNVQERLLFHARHSDLTILGRHGHPDLMPPGLIETILMKSGRPVVIVPQSLSDAAIDTVVVGWKDTPQAARALAAATPILEHARRVVLINVAEGPQEDRTVEQQQRQLASRGIATEYRLLRRTSDPVGARLVTAARELGAGLLVVGGYGRGPLREQVFGGVTQELIQHADVPVFMLH